MGYRHVRLTTTILALALASVSASAQPRGADQPLAPLLTNLGSWHRPVATSSDRAQQFFDQGLRMLYAFNFLEADRSFREAARLDPKMAMAGKTGTSQVRRIGAAERATGVIKNENLEWAQRDHALFISYAPADAPRFACAVIVEHGGGGSAVAAPIAKDVLVEVPA